MRGFVAMCVVLALLTACSGGRGDQEPDCGKAGDPCGTLHECGAGDCPDGWTCPPSGLVGCVSLASSWHFDGAKCVCTALPYCDPIHSSSCVPIPEAMPDVPEPLPEPMDAIDVMPEVVDEPVESETAKTDPGPDVDPNCHYDCFGYHECKDGVVTTFAHIPVPCAFWTGSCPIDGSFECVKGCRIDGVTQVDYFDDPSTLCQESAPKHAGDPCIEPADCLPTPAEVVDGKVINTYLACYGVAGTCVAVEPPSVPDWLAPCGTDLSGLPSGAYGYVTAPACSGGVCLIAPDEAGCFAQGCTKHCEHDWDCPPGSVCEDGLKDWLPPATSWVVLVCKPGPHNLIGVDLACPGG